MTNFSTDLKVSLGQLLERSDHLIKEVSHINRRMDKAEEWRPKTTEQIMGLNHRMKALERQQRDSKLKPNKPPRAERWTKGILTSLLFVSPVWLLNPTEHGWEVLKALIELMKALKGGG